MPPFIRTSILERGEPFEILVNGRPVTAFAGESVAAALLAGGQLPTANCQLYCGMGACFGCLVTVDGVPNVRSCATLVRPGLCVELPNHANG
ncbi:MAG: (2Fe-2S)-binding protein [Anaerolineales bacterium]|nr:(2Fe-2S)-binding protein [Anaerolineales bacterium]